MTCILQFILEYSLGKLKIWWYVYFNSPIFFLYFIVLQLILQIVDLWLYCAEMYDLEGCNILR